MGRREIVAKMSARKSTHYKAGVKKIDPNRQYEIQSVGPLCPAFGKRRVKNDKGRPVTKYYLKSTPKLRVWVNWAESFGDVKQRKDYHPATWSAEPQTALEGDTKSSLQSALAKKTVWPWPQHDEDGFQEKRDLLKQAGFKEWQTKTAAGKRQNWLLTNRIEDTETDAQTEALSEDESEEEASESINEEEDEV